MSHETRFFDPNSFSLLVLAGYSRSVHTIELIYPYGASSILTPSGYSQPRARLTHQNTQPQSNGLTRSRRTARHHATTHNERPTYGFYTRGAEAPRAHLHAPNRQEGRRTLLLSSILCPAREAVRLHAGGHVRGGHGSPGALPRAARRCARRLSTHVTPLALHLDSVSSPASALPPSPPLTPLLLHA